MVKNQSANAGDTKDKGSIPGLGRSPGGGNDNTLNILAWRIPWTEEPGGLQSQRVRHDRSNLASTQDFDHQRREASYYCWKMVLAESDTTDVT